MTRAVDDGSGGAPKPLKAFSDSVGVYDIEVLVQYPEKAWFPHGVCQEIPFDMSVGMRVGTVRMVLADFAEGLDSIRPAVRISDEVVLESLCVGWNMRLVVVNL